MLTVVAVNPWLLRRDDGAYRWLVRSQGHWSFVEPVGLADVTREEMAFVGFMHAEAQVNAPLREQIVAATAVVVEGIAHTLAARVGTGELRADAPLTAAVHGYFGGFLFFFQQHRHLGPAAWRREAAAFAAAWAAGRPAS